MQHFISYKNSKIAFSSEGHGSAIILLHGFLENSSMWNEIAPVLAQKNRVICIDLLGHGNSDVIGYVHTMEDQADVVKAVLKHLKLRRVTLIGHSMGGYVALAFAKKYAENVKGLCLVNSTSQADSDERKQLRLRANKMAQNSYQSLVIMSIANLFSEESRTRFQKSIEHTKKEALKTPVEGYIACSEGMRLRKNTETVLDQIDKKLLIFGENDPILDVKSIKNETKRTKTPFLALSQGHMSHIENAPELLDALQNFVKS